MLDAAENAGTIAMIMFSWRWFGVIAELRRLVQDGYVGTCHDAHFVMHGGYAATDGYNWRFDPGRGGGILSDYGSHLIDLARWIVGDIADVVADAATHHPHPDLGGGNLADAANDSSLLLLRFRSGAHGTIEVAGHRHVGPLPSWEVRVYGDEGSLEAEVEPPEFRLRGRRRSDPTWAELAVPTRLSGSEGPHPSILGLAVLAPFTNASAGDRLFIESIITGQQPQPSLEDGWRVQQVIDAAEISSRTRGWVAVDR